MRSILLYLLLVGLPGLGLFALMRLGRRLTPPISVAGTWSVETNSQAVDVSRCVNPFGRSDHPSLTITQSGTHLLVKFNDEEDNVLTGQIYGRHISAEVLSPSATTVVTASSRDTSKILFRAAVDRRTQPDRLSGTLNFVNHPLCADVAFTATRAKARRIEGQ